MLNMTVLYKLYYMYYMGLCLMGEQVLSMLVYCVFVSTRKCIFIWLLIPVVYGWSIELSANFVLVTMPTLVAPLLLQGFTGVRKAGTGDW